MCKKIKNSFLQKKTLIINMLSLVILQGGQYVLALAILPYLARVLSPSQFGIYGLSLAISQYCIMITNYGFDLTSSRDIAQVKGNKSKVSSIFWHVIVTKFFLAIVCFIGVTTICLLFSSLHDYIIPICLASLQVFGAVLLPNWLYQGIEKLWGVAVANLISRSLGVPLIMFFVKDQNDLVYAVGIQSIVAILGGVIGFAIALQKNYVESSIVTLKGIIFNLKDSFSLFLSNIAISLYTVSTVVVMGVVSDAENVGFFNGVDKIRMAISGVFLVLSGAIYPRINSMICVNKKKALLFIKRVCIWQGGVTLICSLLLYFFSYHAVLFGLGGSYLKATNALKIMSPLIFLVTTSVILANYILLSFGYKRIFMVVPIVMAFLHLLMCIPLCHFYGADGGAATILITELITNISLLFFVIKKGLLKEILNAK